MFSMRILGISGSLRTGSYNTKALKAAQALAPAGVGLDIYTLHDIPLYNADVEKEGIPASVAALRDAVVAADAVLICTPEYNYSVSGVLKNALDWLSRAGGKPLEGKAVAIMGASPGRLGTVRAQYHLRQMLVHFNAPVLNSPEVMIAKAHEAFDEAGAFTSEQTAAIVQRQLQALVDFAGLLERGKATAGGS